MRFNIFGSKLNSESTIMSERVSWLVPSKIHELWIMIWFKIRWNQGEPVWESLKKSDMASQRKMGDRDSWKCYQNHGHSMCQPFVQSSVEIPRKQDRFVNHDANEVLSWETFWWFQRIFSENCVSSLKTYSRKEEHESNESQSSFSKTFMCVYDALRGIHKILLPSTIGANLNCYK